MSADLVTYDSRHFGVTTAASIQNEHLTQDFQSVFPVLSPKSTLTWHNTNEGCTSERLKIWLKLCPIWCTQPPVAHIRERPILEPLFWSPSVQVENPPAVLLWLFSGCVARLDYFWNRHWRTRQDRSCHLHLHLSLAVTRGVGAPQMTSQTVSSIFLCSPLPSWTWLIPGLAIPWRCLPTSSSVCLVFFPFQWALQNGLGQTW